MLSKSSAAGPNLIVFILFFVMPQGISHVSVGAGVALVNTLGRACAKAPSVPPEVPILLLPSTAYTSTLLSLNFNTSPSNEQELESPWLFVPPVGAMLNVPSIGQVTLSFVLRTGLVTLFA